MSKLEKKEKAVVALVKFGYITACIALYFIGLVILFFSINSIVHEMLSSDFVVYRILDETALIIFSIAVFDVAKYLTFGEILKAGEKTSDKQEKQRLTKFILIISTAIALEGLVLTIEKSKEQLHDLMYPILLLITSAVFILTIGFYKKLTEKE